MLPTYEVMMRETFSPISPTPLSPILPDLPDLIEEATRSLQEDVKPTTEVRAAPPADTPVVSGVDEAGFTVGNGVPMYSVPPPNFMFSMPNVPIGAALTHRAAVDTPCSRTCILVPSQYAGVVQRVYGGDPRGHHPGDIIYCRRDSQCSTSSGVPSGPRCSLYRARKCQRVYVHALSQGERVGKSLIIERRL